MSVVGSEEGFKESHRMAFESKDNLYVFGTQNNQIQVLNSGIYIKN